MRYSKLLLILLLLAVPFCFGQEVLNNASIVKMHEAGLGDDVLVSAVNGHPGRYTTGTDDIIALKKAGIGDSVIKAILERQRSSPSVGGYGALAPVVTPPEISPRPTLAHEPGKVSFDADATAVGASERPRIFFMSESYGNQWNALRNQSMEMSADFERDCSMVRISINQDVADYTIILNHIERGLIVRDNQIQVADRSGDLIARTQEGGSIRGNEKLLCRLIVADWDVKRADRYANGAGVPQDIFRAFRLYQRAAEDGSARGQFCLGVLYAKGAGVNQDEAQAVHWYSEAADQDNAQAQYALAKSLHNGLGVQRDDNEAFFWTLVAIESGKLSPSEQEQAQRDRVYYESMLSKAAVSDTWKKVKKRLKITGHVALPDEQIPAQEPQ